MVSIVGPAVGGIVIQSTGGYAPAYSINLVSYVVLLVAALAMHPMPPLEVEKVVRGRRAVAEGFGYLRGHRLIQSTFVIDLVAMIFGMPQALFPILAVSQFDRGPAVVGLLFAAPSVGALLQAIASGWAKHVVRQGEAVVWSVVGWGAAIVAFGAAGANLPLALSCLALAGAADVISAIFRNTILQVSTPDHLRGRLSGDVHAGRDRRAATRRLRGGRRRPGLLARRLGHLRRPRVHRRGGCRRGRLPRAPSVSRRRRAVR